jgi:hypothetical protein
LIENFFLILPKNVRIKKLTTEVAENAEVRMAKGPRLRMQGKKDFYSSKGEKTHKPQRPGRAQRR